MEPPGRSPRLIVIVVFNLAVGLLHFVTGPNYRGPWPIFVNGYLIDILLPAALYLLLCANEKGLFKRWRVRAVVVLGIGFGVETLQFFGVPLLGQTFDPLDYVAYTLGVTLAVVLDKILFPRIFSFWTPPAAAKTLQAQRCQDRFF